MKLATIFISRAKQIYAQTLTVSESTFKIKVMHTGFCTKTRLCNIFKTTNTKTLIKAISESPYMLLQKPLKTTTLRQPKYSSRAVQFLAVFKFNFHTALTKSIKLHFFRNCTLVSQNRSKLRQPIRNNGPLKKF